MANLTWDNTQEWGMDGVDLGSLPPKLYAALYRLHELEHDRDKAREHLAEMHGVSEWWLLDVLQRKTGPWHSVEEWPNMVINIEADAITSRRLLLRSEDGDIWPGFCTETGKELTWTFLGGIPGKVTHWMEMPDGPDVSESDTTKGGGGNGTVEN